MAKLSDTIESFIKQLIEEAKGPIEIQRNELAGHFNCVPSQINYVIDTRFTCERGYFVESRRGGGGCISIRRISIKSKDDYLRHIVMSLSDSISQMSVNIFINNFIDYNIISQREANLLKSATSDRILAGVMLPERDKLRAAILKNMLLSLL